MKIKLLVLCCAVLLPQQCRALDYTVENSYDYGTGSLRQAVLDSNSAAGVNTISWEASGGESIFLLSDINTINANTTLDVNPSTNSVTISGNYAMPLGGAVTFNTNRGNTVWKISAVLSGSGSLIKTGGGNLLLTGTNTYSGGTEIDGGVLTVTSDAALGYSTGTITFGGGTLQSSSTFSSSRNIIFNVGGGTFDTNSFNLVLNSTMTGTGLMTKKGTGTLFLNGADNTCTGGTLISSGTIQSGANNALSIGALTMSGDATLNLQGYTQTVSSYDNRAGGILTLKLQDSVTNLAVTGNAALGGTLALNVSPRLFEDGDTFTPISYSTHTGTFSSIIIGGRPS